MSVVTEFSRRDFEATLKRRIAQIGEALSDPRLSASKKLYRWVKFKASEALTVWGSDNKASGWEIWAKRNKEWRGQVRLSDVKVSEITNQTYKTRVTSSKTETTESNEVSNRSDAPATLTLNLTLRKLQSSSESLEVGFEQTSTTTVEGSYGGVNVSQEVALAFHQTLVKELAKETEQQVSVEVQITAKPKSAYRMICERVVQNIETEIYAQGLLEHSTRIGKRKHGRWNRSKHWDSFNEFKTVLSGNGTQSLDLGDWFYNHPLTKAKLAKATADISTPYYNLVKAEDVGGFKTMIENIDTGEIEEINPDQVKLKPRAD